MAHTRIAVLAGLAFVALSTGGALAETRDIACPREARGVVSHNGDADWTATNQSSPILSISMERIGGQPALVCHYRMFGGDYWIWRRPPIAVQICAPLPGSNWIFSCNNGRSD